MTDENRMAYFATTLIKLIEAKLPPNSRPNVDEKSLSLPILSLVGYSQKYVQYVYIFF